MAEVVEAEDVDDYVSGALLPVDVARACTGLLLLPVGWMTTRGRPSRLGKHLTAVVGARQ